MLTWLNRPLARFLNIFPASNITSYWNWSSKKGETAELSWKGASSKQVWQRSHWRKHADVWPVWPPASIKYFLNLFQHVLSLLGLSFGVRGHWQRKHAKHSQQQRQWRTEVRSWWGSRCFYIALNPKWAELQHGCCTDKNLDKYFKYFKWQNSDTFPENKAVKWT